MMIAGFCDLASVGNLVCLGVGTVTFISGAPLLVVGLVNLGMASKIKKIHALATGQKSFTPRISTTGGLNGENKQLEIALGYRF